MKTIIEGKQVPVKLLGSQRPKDTMYRLMKYTLSKRCRDGILLHNCISGQLVLLNHNEAAMLEKMPISYSAGLNGLIEQYYLVPLDYDEKATVDTLRKMMRAIFTPKGINGYTIMTTTNCNARCFYCYQAGFQHITMTKETADCLVKYMIQNKGEDPLHIQWFGGEPLVGIDRIDQISTELKNNNISFSSSMISNGFLFSEEIVERAISLWKLRNVQITLDGTEEVYNKTKSYITKCENPYRRVVENIKILLEHHIQVGIRINLDQHNAEDLERLIEDISNEIHQKKYLNMYVHVVYENEGYAPIARTAEKRKELYKLQFKLNKVIFDAGLCRQFYSLPSLKYRSCMADNPRSVVIYPDGSLFNCEHTAEGDSFGHITSPIINKTVFEEYFKPVNRVTCDNCPLYPSCLILEKCEGSCFRDKSMCSYEVRLKMLAVERQYRKMSLVDK